MRLAKSEKNFKLLAKDLIQVFQQILPIIVEKNIKVITNGGGVNPQSCREAIFEVAKKSGVKELKVGVVYGDDISGQIDGLTDSSNELKNMETSPPVPSCFVM